MLRQEIETISTIKIRRGFERFLDKAIEYLNVNDFTIENSIKIVMFINSSNSKLSEAYWALRFNKTQDECKVLIKDYIDNFVKSSYKHTNRRNIQRQFQSNNYSRGYSGYVDIDGKKYYCRSSCEFVYLKYFHKMLEPNMSIKVEDRMFHIGEISYKPDFFIYRNGILEQIIEVKDNINGWDKKYDIFSEYFKSINIQFSFVYDSNLILKRDKQIKQELDEWIKNYAIIPLNMQGRNNPNFGNKYTDEQKIKVQRNRMIQQLIRVYDKINFNVDTFDELVLQTNELKRVNLINKYMPYSIDSFKKYFNNIDILKQELNNVNNKNN